MSQELNRAMQRANDSVQHFSPFFSADIVESLDDFHVHVDLPGVNPNDLDISVVNGFLNIKAERRQKHEEDVGFTHNIERSYGKVQRSVAIPARSNDNDQRLSN